MAHQVIKSTGQQGRNIMDIISPMNLDELEHYSLLQ